MTQRIGDLMARLMPQYSALTDAERQAIEQRAKNSKATYDAIFERERVDNRRRVLDEMGVSRGEYLDVEPMPSLPMSRLRVALLGHARGRRSDTRGAVILLIGGNGCGKSFAATHWVLRARGKPWYATAHQLVAWASETYQKPAPPWAGSVYVLDQMGHERRTDKMSDFFTHILRIGAVLVATTDLSSVAFRQRYAGHIVDRLDEPRPGLPYGGFVDCGDISWRTNRAQAEKATGQ